MLRKCFYHSNCDQSVLLHNIATHILAWSREGCKTFPGKVASTVRCKCTHLTSFALLLDPSETTKELLLLNQVSEPLKIVPQKQTF